MADNSKEQSILIETLSVYKAMEGLIHNVNTPLNVIIGYSQQLKKKYPDIAGLEQIYEAGLKLDDLIRSSSDSLQNRLISSSSKFDLNNWLMDETKFLQNILEVKHTLSFEITTIKNPLRVKTNKMQLSLFFVSIILYLKNKTELAKENNIVSIGVNKQDNKIILDIRFPEYKKLRTGIKEYLTELKNELKCASEEIFTDDYPFSWEVITEEHIKISIKAES